MKTLVFVYLTVSSAQWLEFFFYGGVLEIKNYNCAIENVVNYYYLIKDAVNYNYFIEDVVNYDLAISIVHATNSKSMPCAISVV